jgi:hypothetical protein
VSDLVCTLADMSTTDAVAYITDAITLAGDDTNRLESARQGLVRLQVDAYREAVAALADEDDREARALLVRGLDARLEQIGAAHETFTEHLLGVLGRRG